jgi:sarcosine oxidase subunit gamma
MPDHGLAPLSALAGIARPGRHGRQAGPPGLWLQERDGLQIVSLAAHAGQAARLAQAVQQRFRIELPATPRVAAADGVAFAWSGAAHWLAIAAADAAPLEPALRATAASLAAITAVGDGRVVLRLGGPAVRDVLAAVIPIDLHPGAFRPNDTALTLAGQIAVQIRRLDDTGDFEIMAFRGYAASLFHALLEAGLSFGVEVRPTTL